MHKGKFRVHRATSSRVFFFEPSILNLYTKTPAMIVSWSQNCKWEFLQPTEYWNDVQSSCASMWIHRVSKVNGSLIVHASSIHIVHAYRFQTWRPLARFGTQTTRFMRLWGPVCEEFDKTSAQSCICSTSKQTCNHNDFYSSANNGDELVHGRNHANYGQYSSCSSWLLYTRRLTPYGQVFGWVFSSPWGSWVCRHAKLGLPPAVRGSHHWRWSWSGCARRLLALLLWRSDHLSRSDHSQWFCFVFLFFRALKTAVDCHLNLPRAVGSK